MKLSLSVPPENKTPTHGFGVAGLGMVESLRTLGYTVNFNDATAPVEIAFSQPTRWTWTNPDAYHIGYMPWESTRLPEEFIPHMLGADELWATSPWVARVLDKHGFPDVKVYEHGIDTGLWYRERRKWDGKIKFLHLGEPAPRKGGQLVFDTFVDLFADRKDVSLTIKADTHHFIRGIDRFDLDDDGNVLFNEKDCPSNVNVITDSLSPEALADLVRAHDVLVYPSWGEGFGLIPLQAMVTGMPVICPTVWAPYRHLILSELVLPSKLVQSPWPELHPGGMYEPNADELRKIMLRLAEPIEFMDASIRAYQRSFQVEAEYDWLKLTAEAFENLSVSV